MGRRDFRGAVVDLFERRLRVEGRGRDPEEPAGDRAAPEAALLLFITGRRNARDLAPAVNDYVMIFQKPGEAPPVPALRGDENPDGWVTHRRVDPVGARRLGRHPRDRRARGLAGRPRGGRREARLPAAARGDPPLREALLQPGELVLDPFMGIGSTAYVALEQGRDAVGFELKESYHGGVWTTAIGSATSSWSGTRRAGCRA
jgi:hypothetical protein